MVLLAIVKFFVLEKSFLWSIINHSSSIFLGLFPTVDFYRGYVCNDHNMVKTIARTHWSQKLYGQNAKFSVLLSWLHPSVVVDAKFSNRLFQKQLQDLVCKKTRMQHKAIAQKISFLFFTVNSGQGVLILQKIVCCPRRRSSWSLFRWRRWSSNNWKWRF